MKTVSTTPRQLRRNQLLRFARPRRLCLRAERGTLWVTVDGEPVDIQLDAGQSRVFDGTRPVIVSALGGDAVLTASTAVAPLASHGPASLADGWLACWHAWLQPLGRGLRRAMAG